MDGQWGEQVGRLTWMFIGMGLMGSALMVLALNRYWFILIPILVLVCFAAAIVCIVADVLRGNVT